MFENKQAGSGSHVCEKSIFWAQKSRVPSCDLHLKEMIGLIFFLVKFVTSEPWPMVSKVEMLFAVASLFHRDFHGFQRPPFISPFWNAISSWSNSFLPAILYIAKKMWMDDSVLVWCLAFPEIKTIHHVSQDKKDEKMQIIFSSRLRNSGSVSFHILEDRNIFFWKCQSCGKKSIVMCKK